MCEKMDNAINAAKQCGDKNYFCKGMQSVLELTKTVQMMQLQEPSNVPLLIGGK